jgi:prepilin-type processing-associated H-X9-DG protein
MLYNDPVELSQIVDGASYTAALAELGPRRVSTTEWACGHNIFAQLDTNPVNGAAGFDNEIASPHPGGALVAFCDGRVDFVADDAEQRRLNAMLTRSGDDSP